METLWLLQLLFNLVMLAGLFVLARGQGGRRPAARGPARKARRRLLPRLRFPLRRRTPAPAKEKEKDPAPASSPAPAAASRLEVPSVLADLVAEAERREELAAERALRERLAAFRAREAS